MNKFVVLDRGTMPAAHAGGVGLPGLFNSMMRRKRHCVLIVAACVAAGALYLARTPPLYEADAILRAPGKPDAAAGALADAANFLPRGATASDEAKVLISREVIEAAAIATHADIAVDRPSYFPGLDSFLEKRFHRHGRTAQAAHPPAVTIGMFDLPSGYDGLAFWLDVTPAGAWRLLDDKKRLLASGTAGQATRFPLDAGAGAPTGTLEVDAVSVPADTRFRVVKSSLQTAFRDLSLRLSASVSARDSSLIDVVYRDVDPLFAARFVNALAKAYTTLALARRAEEARQSSAFIKERLPALKKELEVAEARLSAFRGTSQTLDFQLQTDAALKKSLELARQKTLVQLTYEQARRLYQPTHPIVESIQRQLEAISHEESSDAAAVRSLPAAQQTFLRLSRDVAVDAQLYTALLTSVQQLEVAAASTVGTLAVVEHAAPPEIAVWPKKAGVLLASLAAGLLAAVTFAFWRATVRREITGKADVEALSIAPVVATLPRAARRARGAFAGERSWRAPASTAGDLPDARLEPLRLLRARMMAMLRADAEPRAGKVVLFASPSRTDDGFIETNLGCLLAEAGMSVALIDANVGDPVARRCFPTATRYGLTRLLQGSASLREAIQAPHIAGVDVIHVGEIQSDALGEPPERPGLPAVIGEMAKTYDWVIIGGSPVLERADTVATAPFCDWIFLTVEAGVTGAGELSESVERLNGVGAEVAGIVLT